MLAIVKSDETVSLHQNVDDHQRRIRAKRGVRPTAYNNALKEAERIAPKHATREDCVAEFGEGVSASARTGWHGAGKIRRRPQQPAGSFWMPLMAGYMMGLPDGRRRRLAQQPPFSRKPGQPLHTANIPMRQVKTTVLAQPGRQ